MRRALALALALVVACVAFTGCGDDSGQPAGRAVVDIEGAAVTAEVADDEASRQRGLSGRDSLDPDSGMLFLLPGDSPSFWMKGMRFPIDIVWIKGARVVDVTAGVPPPAGTNAALATYSPDRPADRVLEVNAGWAARHGVGRGDRVRVRPAPESG
jgi:uncharacterized protein